MAWCGWLLVYQDRAAIPSDCTKVLTALLQIRVHVLLMHPESAFPAKTGRCFSHADWEGVGRTCECSIGLFGNTGFGKRA